MSFILSADRTSTQAVTQGFARYRSYLREHQRSIDPALFAIAASEYHYNPADARCPHDHWLSSALLVERSIAPSDQEKILNLTLTLCSHDGSHRIEYLYTNLTHYDLRWQDAQFGHRNWRYDEFRLTDNGQIIHEIEWWGFGEVGRWIIEAATMKASYPDFPADAT